MIYSVLKSKSDLVCRCCWGFGHAKSTGVGKRDKFTDWKVSEAASWSGEWAPRIAKNWKKWANSTNTTHRAIYKKMMVGSCPFKDRIREKCGAERCFKLDGLTILDGSKVKGIILSKVWRMMEDGFNGSKADGFVRHGDNRIQAIWRLDWYNPFNRRASPFLTQLCRLYMEFCDAHGTDAWRLGQDPDIS